MTPQEILEAVAHKIEMGDWGPRWKGPCILSHLYHLSLQSENKDRFATCLHALHDAVAPSNIVTWNDEPGRTREEAALICYDAKRFLP